MKESNQKGKVYIASMNMRGKWAELDEECHKVNVTSMQAKYHINRINFSPMTSITKKYKDFYCFENYWQSGKRYLNGDSPDKIVNWWKSQNRGRRRYPGSKDKKVIYAEWPGTGPLDYISSRKQIYVPEYYDLIKDKPVLQWKIDMLDQGTNIAVYDFDGPRLDDKSPTSQLVTLDLLQEKINDTRFPFGHGYIVAGAIAGYTPDLYIN